MTFYVTYLSTFEKKGKLREIIDDGLWPFKGNHFCLETDRFLLNLACLFLS